MIYGPYMAGKETAVYLAGIGRTTRWRREREVKFPARVRLSAGAVGWRFSEVMAWLRELNRA